MKKLKIKRTIFDRLFAAIFVATLVSFVVFPLAVQADYKIEQLGEYSGNKDFVVGPGKVEVTLNPGESRTIDAYVTNRMGDDRVFNLEIEDFVGSQKTDQTVVLLGDEKGPYSLKDYISFGSNGFELKNNERATIPITISVPLDVEPGGHYGSVLVTNTTKGVDREVSGATGGTALVSRIGILFFVRVPGEVNEKGEVADFQIVGSKKFLSSGPVNFQILFRNEGSVHLNPYGEISIKNIFGQEVGLIEIEPWFAMPDSLRLREVRWDPSILIGRYVAELSVNRGYENIIDSKTLVFYVVSWKLIVVVFVGFAVLMAIIKLVTSRFEIRRK